MQQTAGAEESCFVHSLAIAWGACPSIEGLSGRRLSLAAESLPAVKGLRIDVRVVQVLLRREGEARHVTVGTPLGSGLLERRPRDRQKGLPQADLVVQVMRLEEQLPLTFHDKVIRNGPVR